MTGKTINHSVVIKMHATGFSVRQISERLCCSFRQVKRILSANNLPGKNTGIDQECEFLLRTAALTLESYDAAARRFGVSKQTMALANNFKNAKDFNIIEKGIIL